METPGKSFWISPTRALQGASDIVVGARNTGSISWVAARSFLDDLASPRTATEQVMATHARTFRFATRFLPLEFRDPTLKLYVFFRTLDDLVDDSPDDSDTRHHVADEINAWDEWFRTGRQGSAPRSEIGREISLISSQYGISSHVFLDFLAGMRADLDPETPATRQDIEHYSYQVASTVGIAMAHVFGTTGNHALEAATRLGIGMQLTNILRDVGGDLARGRMYLPESLLTTHELTSDEITSMWASGSGPDERLRAVIQEVVGWADEHYAAGIAGVRLLPPDVRMPILVSARLYQRILRQLERNDCDSLRKRASTTRFQKLSEAYRSVIALERIGTAPKPDQREASVDAG